MEGENVSPPGKKFFLEKVTRKSIAFRYNSLSVMEIITNFKDQNIARSSVSPGE